MHICCHKNTTLSSPVLPQVYEAPPECVMSKENCISIRPFVTSEQVPSHWHLLIHMIVKSSCTFG